MPISVAAVATFAFAPPAAPTMVIATMGMCRNEFCILCHDI